MHYVNFPKSDISIISICYDYVGAISGSLYGLITMVKVLEADIIAAMDMYQVRIVTCCDTFVMFHSFLVMFHSFSLCYILVILHS